MRHTVITGLISLVILGGISLGARAEEIRYARYPALSPDNQTIAFAFRGDIWTVPSSGGQATRLTVHQADDTRPYFSPDGAMILFSSRRYNNSDVFIIPSGGGQPKQLTTYSGSDVGAGWFPGSDSVLLVSYHDGAGDIYKVSVDGGTPILLTGYAYENEFNPRLTSDGRYLLYNNGAGARMWWRRDLKTSQNSDIFLADRRQSTFTSRRLTDFSGHDLWPIINEARGEVYFVSCRGEWAQVYKMPLTGGEAVPLTDFTGDGVQWLNANPQGTMLVFEQNFHIWILDPAGGQPRRVPIEIKSDERANLIEKETFTGDVEWFSLSPDEKKIAAVIHGEIFVIPADEPKEGKRITVTAAREIYPVWGSDSRTIYYSSDRAGNYDLYAADAVTGVEKRLTTAPENDLKPIVSPDGKQVAFCRGLDRIVHLDLETGRETVWVTGNFSDMGVEPTIEYDWSPDSKWLTFTMAGPTYETDIHVVPVDGAPVNISKFAGGNFRPRFAADGKTIYFTSGVSDRLETYTIELTYKPDDFYEAKLDSLFLPKPPRDSTAKTDTLAPKEVTIDFDRIENRRNRAYRLAASSEYPALTPDGKKFIFAASILGKPELWSVSTEDDPDLKQLTHSGKGKRDLVVTKDSKAVFYLEEGRIKRTELDGGKTTALDFTAVIDVDAVQLNQQKFREAWQMLNSYFYDPSFHGADWQAAGEKYRPLVDQIRTESEFGNLLRELMGELRASHLDVYSREPGPDATVVTGETGITLDFPELDRNGNFRVAQVIPESPAALAGITPGSYITALNRVPLTPRTDFFAPLAGTIGHRLTMTIGDKPGQKGRDVYLKPISNDSLSTLVYRDWVAGRRRMVDSLSQGRLAYIHIPAMSGGQLERFKEQLVSIAESKDGLVIDVRNNSGGSIAVHLLGILERTPYFLRRFRDFPLTSENKMRSKALEKPMTLLINGYSVSNAEIFAEGFRRLKLGKIIGEPTAGGVIGTGSYSLIDGTTIRRPSWGAYTLDMEDTDLAPRHPDIVVENLPDDFINGRDPQLVRAIQELMKQLR